MKNIMKSPQDHVRPPGAGERFLAPLANLKSEQERYINLRCFPALLYEAEWGWVEIVVQIENVDGSKTHPIGDVLEAPFTIRSAIHRVSNREPESSYRVRSSRTAGPASGLVSYLWLQAGLSRFRVRELSADWSCMHQEQAPENWTVISNGVSRFEISEPSPGV
jgi:hypothetical protein